MCFEAERENFVADTAGTPFQELIIRKMALTNLFALLIKNEPVTIRFAGQVDALVFHPLLPEFIANPAAAIRAINRVNNGASATTVRNSANVRAQSNSVAEF